MRRGWGVLAVPPKPLYGPHPRLVAFLVSQDAVVGPPKPLPFRMDPAAMPFNASPKAALPGTDRTDRLPMAALVILAAIGFTAITTELLPSGLLPQVSAGLGVSEA